MTYVILVATAVLGLLALPERLRAAAAPALALGFAAAVFGISLEMFWLRLLGAPASAWIALVPWCAAAAWSLRRGRPRIGVGISLGGGLAAAATLLALWIWLPYERVMPLTSRAWDAWAIWLFKAKAFHLDGDIGTYLARSSEFVGQPGYPLLTPLYATFLYEINGGVADALAKLISPASWLAALGVFYYVSRRIADPLIAGALTAMLACTPMIQRTAFELAGYAEATLMLYLIAAAGFLALWIRDGDRVDLGAASLSAAAAAWTKNEGQFFLLGFAAIAAAKLIRRRAAAMDWAWLAAPPAIALAPWSAVRAYYGVEAAGFDLVSGFQPHLFRTALAAMTAKAAALDSFVLTFPALLAAIVVGAWVKAPAACWVAPGLAAWQFLGALSAYASGRNEIEWWLATSADRLLAQIAPLALLTIAGVAGWKAGTKRETAANPTARRAEPPRRKRRRVG